MRNSNCSRETLAHVFPPWHFVNTHGEMYLNCLCLCTVAWWPHSKKVPGLNPGRGLSVWSLYVLPVLAWVFSWYSGFLPQSKDMHIRLIGGSKLPEGVIVNVYGYLSTCGPVMDWRPVQGVSLPFTRRELG